MTVSDAPRPTSTSRVNDSLPPQDVVTRVSRRLRFEILKRDNYTCRYCGGKAPDARLAVDHVIPASLGGSNDPGNLVTACVDCNNGKGSSNPESELVKDVSAASALYIAELQEKMAPIRERLTRELQYIATFSEQWGSYEFDGKDVPLPPTWRATLRRFEKMGVPIVLVCYAIEIAMGKQDVSASETFRYMCGVVYRTIENEVKA